MKWILILILSGLVGCQPDRKTEIREQKKSEPEVSVPEKPQEVIPSLEEDHTEEDHNPSEEEEHVPPEEDLNTDSGSIPGKPSDGPTEGPDEKHNGSTGPGDEPPTENPSDPDPQEEIDLEMRSSERAMKRAHLASSVLVDGFDSVSSFGYYQANPRILEVQIRNYNSEPVILAITESSDGVAWQPYYKHFDRNKSLLCGHQVTRFFYRIIRNDGVESRGDTHFVTVEAGELLYLFGYVDGRSDFSRIIEPTAYSRGVRPLAGVYYDLTEKFKNYVTLYLMDDNYRLVHQKKLDEGAQSRIGQRISIKGVSSSTISPDRILSHHSRELDPSYYSDSKYFSDYPIENHMNEDCRDIFQRKD